MHTRLFEFLRQFQGMDMQTRLTQSHVVFESRSWIAAFTVSMTLNKRLIPAIVSRLGGDCGQLHTALEALSAFVVGKPNQVVPEAITRTAEVIGVGAGDRRMRGVAQQTTVPVLGLFACWLGLQTSDQGVTDK